MFKGVWVLLGARLSDGCVGFVGGVIAVWTFGTMFSTMVEGISVSVVCYLVWVCCSTYA
jgi:hypothetical protein